MLAAEGFRELIDELAEREIVEGAADDALIAAVARAAGATLLTCDRRAETTDVRVGARVEYVA